jgi:hypothetical protein
MKRCNHKEGAPIHDRILLVSYASGMPGFSPSEWVDSKLTAARRLGQHVTLITSAGSQLDTCEHQRVVKLHSLSLRDFVLEQAENRGRISLSSRLSSVFAKSLGRLFDRLFFRIVGSNSDGRWSWVISATPVIIYFALRLRPKALLATGGPSSALLSAALASYTPWVPKPVIELQDPFIGAEMKLAARAMLAMELAQKFLLHSARKYVVVSEGSKTKLVSKYPEFKHKVVCIYPYAQDHDGVKDFVAGHNGGGIELLHLGTLYGTRNLRSLFDSIDAGVLRGAFKAGDFRVTNVGADYTGIERQGDFSPLSALEKTAAIRRASQADVLLLVQHTDDRSLETIPFKFYDYLNLDTPILVLGRNEEIRNLLTKSDFYANVLDAAEIQLALSAISNAYQDGGLEVCRSKPRSGRPLFMTAWSELIK